MGDERGFFLESFNKRRLEEHGIEMEIKQINFAKSQKNVLRGLHYQLDPYAQSKLVGVISGAVRDVVVDLRPTSPSYKKHLTLDITSPDICLYIPKGFAHGYFTLEENTVFYYGVNDFYNPNAERGIRYDDPELKIVWGETSNAIISQKDLMHPFIS